MPNVSYDSRAVVVDGKRQLILSGAIHYPRSTPGMWPELMKRSKEAGLNTIETYVFWNFHEAKRGVYDFSGRLDVREFCRCAQREGMHVILRIGPYICAETNYGGFPAWLRDVPGIRFRTNNEPFKRMMEKWTRFFVGYMKDLFAPAGGPIILAQIENEYGNVKALYGAEGDKYAQWAIDMGLSLDIGVPWIMCVGGAPGAIETINAFNGFPEIAGHWSRNPEQPAIWTEAWSAWYDVWGVAHHVRSVENMAWSVARFFAEGGAGINYYMWHGGTNFGRESMYLQTPYYYEAPLDEFGLPTTASKHLARLHKLLADHAEIILSSPRPTPVRLGEKQSISAFGSGAQSLVFLSNDDTAAAAEIPFEGKSYAVPARSVTILAGGAPAFNTSEISRASAVRRKLRSGAARLSPFVTRVEPMPSKRPAGLAKVVAPRPVEQLLLTNDDSDYCWYETKLPGGEGELRIDGAGDVLYVFVDGKLVAVSPVPTEDRTGERFKASFLLKLKPGRRDFAILACALGMIKGDWSLGNRNMAEEKKGIWGQVTWRGRELPGPWTTSPFLVGESARLFAEGAVVAKWSKATKSLASKPLRWHRATFKRPAGNSPLALDLGGMTKGLAWLNGKCIGRYWLVSGADAAQPWMKAFVSLANVGEPSQRYYHLPKDWLADVNTITLFEEVGGDLSTVKVCEWR